jgi:hypothetical protein
VSKSSAGEPKVSENCAIPWDVQLIVKGSHLGEELLKVENIGRQTMVCRPISLMVPATI